MSWAEDEEETKKADTIFHAELDVDFRETQVRRGRGGGGYAGTGRDGPPWTRCWPWPKGGLMKPIPI